MHFELLYAIGNTFNCVQTVFRFARTRRVHIGITVGQLGKVRSQKGPVFIVAHAGQAEITAEVAPCITNPSVDLLNFTVKKILKNDIVLL